MVTMMKPTLASRMKDLRTWLDVPQRDFAKVIDVASGTIASWESGKVQELKMDTLRRIADALGVQTAVLADYFAGDVELGALKDAGASWRTKQEPTMPESGFDPDLTMFIEGWPVLSDEEKAGLMKMLTRAALLWLKPDVRVAQMEARARAFAMALGSGAWS